MADRYCRCDPFTGDECANCRELAKERRRAHELAPMLLKALSELADAAEAYSNVSYLAMMHYPMSARLAEKIGDAKRLVAASKVDSTCF